METRHLLPAGRPAYMFMCHLCMLLIPSNICSEFAELKAYLLAHFYVQACKWMPACPKWRSAGLHRCCGRRHILTTP